MGRVDGRVHRRIRSRSQAIVEVMQDVRGVSIGAFSADPVRGSTDPSHDETHGVPSRMAQVASSRTRNPLSLPQTTHHARSLAIRRANSCSEVSHVCPRHGSMAPDRHQPGPGGSPAPNRQPVDAVSVHAENPSTSQTLGNVGAIVGPRRMPPERVPDRLGLERTASDVIDLPSPRAYQAPERPESPAERRGSSVIAGPMCGEGKTKRGEAWLTRPAASCTWR